MRPAIKPDSRPPIPPTLDEVIAEIQKYLPETQDDGRFCRSDLMRMLGLNGSGADNLMRRLDRRGLIEPAGTVIRPDRWKKSTAGRNAWRLAIKGKDGGDERVG